MTDGGNGAEQMQDAHAERQEHEKETGKTSTGTPGNSESGVDTTGAEDGGPRSRVTES